MEHPNKMIDSFEGTIEIFNENTRILRKEVRRPRHRQIGDKGGERGPIGREGGREGGQGKHVGRQAGSGRKAALCRGGRPACPCTPPHSPPSLAALPTLCLCMHHPPYPASYVCR